MSEHTPTPWWIADAAGTILGPDAETVATTYTGRTYKLCQANAQHIVKAVNAHDALVKALEQIAGLGEDDDDDDPEYEIARKALAGIHAFAPNIKTARRNEDG